MEFSFVYWFLVYVSLSSALFPLFIPVLFYSRLNAVTIPFFWFFYFVVLNESFSYTLILSGHQTQWWMNIYFLVEAMAFCSLLPLWLWGNKSFPWVMGLLLVFMMYWIYITFLKSNILLLNAPARAAECLVVLTLSGLMLIRLTRKSDISIFKNPKFWIASGSMLYFSFDLLVFGILPVLVANKYIVALFEPVWDVHSVINIISNLLYSTAFLCPNRTFWFQNKTQYSFSALS